MFSLEIECERDEKDFLIAELWEQGSVGIAELNPCKVRAFFEDSARRTALLGMYPGSLLRVEEQRDWVQTARNLLQPMQVGERFFLVPAWRGDPTPPGRLRIAVNPGLAFGTGVHESTQLCLEALERYLSPGMTVLDVGTGFGHPGGGRAAARRGKGLRLRRGPGRGGNRRAVGASPAQVSGIGGRGGGGSGGSCDCQYYRRLDCAPRAGSVACAAAGWSAADKRN